MASPRKRSLNWLSALRIAGIYCPRQPLVGLAIHFFSAPELNTVVGDGFQPLLPLRLDRRERQAKELGSWAQWETIWRR